jgi:hypothetical protein
MQAAPPHSFGAPHFPPPAPAAQPQAVAGTPTGQAPAQPQYPSHGSPFGGPGMMQGNPAGR